MVDLILFAGQSNMAGRGVTCEKWPEAAPAIIPGAGYEFRAVSDPTKLYVMEEPFGVNENRIDGIYDIRNGIIKKSGSMVTAFTNAYRETALQLGKEALPVVGISASKGGSCSAWWLPGSPEGFMEDCLLRCRACEDYLAKEGIGVRHRFVVWCQGESDADNGYSEETFKGNFGKILNAFKEFGFEKLFMIQIGQRNTAPDDSFYEEVMRWQEELAGELDGVVMAAKDFAGMRERGLMKDMYHYYQAGYNECGKTAGTAAAKYI